jgi:hypothetical protein
MLGTNAISELNRDPQGALARQVAGLKRERLRRRCRAATTC